MEELSMKRRGFLSRKSKIILAQTQSGIRDSFDESFSSFGSIDEGTRVLARNEDYMQPGSIKREFKLAAPAKLELVTTTQINILPKAKETEVARQGHQKPRLKSFKSEKVVKRSENKLNTRLNSQNEPRIKSAWAKTSKKSEMILVKKFNKDFAQTMEQITSNQMPPVYIDRPTFDLLVLHLGFARSTDLADETTEESRKVEKMWTCLLESESSKSGAQMVRTENLQVLLMAVLGLKGSTPANHTQQKTLNFGFLNSEN